MFNRLLILLLTLTALTACVLQSEKPLFAEADGELALQPLGNTFVPFNLSDGEWRAEKEHATFTARGQHYEVKGEDGKITTVLFVALGPGAWVMQASEDERHTAFVIARRDGRALLLQVPACDGLKTNAVLAARLRFAGDDCFAPGDFTLAEFRALADSLPPAKMKLLAQTQPD